MLLEKVDCVCGHGYDIHSSYSENKPCCSKEIEAPFPVCPCTEYDPAGHNPELINVMCPACRLSLMDKGDRFYFCYGCGHTLFDKQVEEITGKKHG